MKDGSRLVRWDSPLDEDAKWSGVKTARAEDVVELYKATHPLAKNMSEEEVLESFMTTHWAWFVEDISTNNND